MDTLLLKRITLDLYYKPQKVETFNKVLKTNENKQMKESQSADHAVSSAS
jgi:hypothetical protein